MMTMQTEQTEQAVWLVMGVSGSGKTSLAHALAQATGGAWIDADDYHPQRNVHRMQQGQPLGDADRWPWLAAVAEAALRLRFRSEGPVFVACSALKQGYRDLLRDRLPGLKVLFLDGDEVLIRERMQRRQNHYMAASMLASQFQDLQSPRSEPGVHVLDIRPRPVQVLAAALALVAGPPDRP